MSYTDETSEQDWKEQKIKHEKSKDKSLGKSKMKYYQRFCDKWLESFHPWLARCSEDPTKPFCRACQCRLDSNKCHLHRHEQTSKHARNLQILISKGEGAARQNLSIRQERSKYYQRKKQLSAMQDGDAAMQEDPIEEYVEDTETFDKETNFQFVQTDTVGSADQYSDEHSMKNEEIVKNEIPNNTKEKHKDRSNKTHQTMKKGASHIKREQKHLLEQIKMNKNTIIDSFTELIRNSTGLTPPKERSPVDLFFDSVSSSVKALPLKLIAEAKMRVSQLVCELELRALTEYDGNQTINSGLQNNASVIVHPAENLSTPAQFVALS